MPPIGPFAAPKSRSPPLKRQAENEATSNAVKEQFWLYIYGNRYATYIAPAKTQKKTEERFKEKLEIMKRIENAIQAGAQEILTFEFSHLFSPCAVGGDVAAEFFLIAFNGQEPPELFPLFNGTLPLHSGKDKHLVNFHVPPSFTDTSSVFLIAKVDVAEVGGRSRRSKAAEDAYATGANKETFWGAKSVSRQGDSSFQAIYGNSSLNLLCPSKFPSAHSSQMLEEPDWFLDKDAVIRLEAELKGQMALASLPSVHYELSDQYYEEDWDEIREALKQWAERTEIKDGKAMAFIVEGQPPDKEGKTPSETSVQPSVLLKLPLHRSPFTGADFASQEELLTHLNSAYCRLHFASKDDCIIIVRLASELEKVKKEPHKWLPGPLPDRCLPFNAPRVKDLGAFGIRHVPHGSFRRDFICRTLADELSVFPKATEFMLMVNKHMMDAQDISMDWGQRAVREAVKEFVVLRARELVDKDMDLMTLTMAMRLQQHRILTPDDYAEIFEVLANCLD